MTTWPTYKRRFYALLAGALLLPLCSAAATISPEEVKASYILKLVPFVTLGQPSHKVSQICYYEKAGVSASESVGQILGKYLQTHPRAPGEELNIKWFQAIRDFSGCDIIFIPASEEANIDNILAQLGSSPTLTISAAKQFIFRGGMIGFVVDSDNRVRMEGNLKNIKSAGVRVDALVLELMQQVINQ